jgi:hypothetical protein
MGRHGAVVVEVESLGGLFAQGEQGTLPILAWHFAGGDQGLKAQGEDPTGEVIKFGEGTGSRQDFAKRLQDVFKDMSRISGATAHQVHANELVTLLELSSKSLEHRRFPEPGARSAQQDNPTVSALSHIQESFQFFESLMVDTINGVLVLTSEYFEPRAERISETHSKAEKKLNYLRNPR